MPCDDVVVAQPADASFDMYLPPIMNLTLHRLSPIDPHWLAELPIPQNYPAIEWLDASVIRYRNVEVTPDLLAALEIFGQKYHVDHCAVSEDSFMTDYKLLALDMDSTLITIECIDEMADLCGKRGEVTAMTASAMSGKSFDYIESMTQRVALLKELALTDLQKIYDERLMLSDGAERLIQRAKASGFKILLISGGFDFFTEKLKARLGLDYAKSNRLGMHQGRLTGKLEGEIVDSTVKARVVRDTCRQLGIGVDQAIVMGDGANDLEMMAIAGLSVGFRPKAIVRKHVDVALNFVGMDAVLDLIRGREAAEIMTANGS